MPWKGVTVSEQRQRFLEDYQLNYYSITELSERFSISTGYACVLPLEMTGGALFLAKTIRCVLPKSEEFKYH